MLTLIGLVLVIISTIFIYRAAKQNGHNATKWAVITAVVGIVLQLVIPIAAGMILAFVWVAAGKTMPQIQEDILFPAVIIGVVCLVINFVVVVLIMKRVSGIAETNPVAAPPPPPPSF